VAARLGDLARERWRRARGWRIRPPRGVTGSPWPDDVAADLRDLPVAIARTEPEYAGHDAVREVERLYLDAIAAAGRTIYIENQYFTSRRLTEALASRLADDAGPEVVLVLPRKTGGWLEQVTMDVVRARTLDYLADADRHRRLRVCYPHQPGLGDDCISVHAKLLIVDDRLLRVGSSNASNRSMGLDTECDVAIEAGPGDRVTTAYIRDLRLRLLAEHLDSDPDAVQDAIERKGSLVAAIDALSGEGRSLRPLDWRVDPEVDDLVPDDGLIDPPEPFSPDYFVAEYVPQQGRDRGRRRLWILLAVVAGLLALGAAWRWTPLSGLLAPEQVAGYLASVASPEARAVVAVAGFAVASLAMVPLTLLAIVAGVAFPGWQAFGYILSGAMIAAGIGFAVGRVAGRRAIEQLSGSRIEQLSRRLARRGTVAVAILRLVPVSPFAVFNLVAGSSHIGVWQFMAGTFLGLIPGLGALALFSNSLWEAIRAPSVATLGVVAVVGSVLLLLAWLARRWLRSG
jgi:phospholipase D1/2